MHQPNGQSLSSPVEAPLAPASSPANAAYLSAKVMTASPEQLQLMLYDGAVRFAEQGRVAIESKQFDRSYDRLSKAQNIVLELQHGLKPTVAPDLCKNLAALYTFAYMRLVEANITHEIGHIEEAIRILRYQRETWILLMQQTTQHKTSAATRVLPIPSPAAARVERLSVAG